jgi:hypothetical protein
MVTERMCREEDSVFLQGKGEGKVSPVLLTKHHTMKAYWGVEI